MLRCGVDLFGFDQLLQGDGRLEASVWSWAPGEPRADGGSCAVARASDGRWVSASCDRPRPAACRTPGGAWELSRPTSAARAEDACEREGAAFAAPRTGHEQALLRLEAGDRAVLLGLRRVDGVWRAADAR